MGNDDTKLVEVAWEGDSLAVLRSFPKAIRTEFGLELYRLQLGEMPLDSKPMKSIGQGVFELRLQEEMKNERKARD